MSAPRLNPQWLVTANMHRLAGLLLYQGFLVGPVMGVGIFLFPRLLGNAFGGPEPGVETRKSWRNMSLTALVLVTSFGVEVWVNPNAGLLLRVAAFGFALSNVKWLSKPGAPQVGTLANALRIWCLPLALAGLIAPVFFYSRRIAVDHLRFISGFGLVCLIAGSRVLFGHSGRVERFSRRTMRNECASGVGGREVMLDADDAEGGLWRGHEGDHDAEWIGFWIFPR